MLRGTSGRATGPRITARRAHGPYAPNRVPARDQVLRLQLLAAARREAHAEVRQAVGPEARPAQLRRAGRGVEAEDGVPVDGRRDRAEEVVPYVLGLVRDPALDPDLIHVLAPAGKDADAVAARGDLVEVLVEGFPSKALEDPLAHPVGGLHVQGDPGDRAQRAEPDHEAV